MNRDQVLHASRRALDMEEVPPGKWIRMLQRTVAGASCFGIGIFAASQGMAWTAIGFGAFGAHLWSGQVMNRGVLSLAETVPVIARAIRKIREALKGLNGGPP